MQSLEQIIKRSFESAALEPQRTQKRFKSDFSSGTAASGTAASGTADSGAAAAASSSSAAAAAAGSSHSPKESFGLDIPKNGATIYQSVILASNLNNQVPAEVTDQQQIFWNSLLNEEEFNKRIADLAAIQMKEVVTAPIPHSTQYEDTFKQLAKAKKGFSTDDVPDPSNYTCRSIAILYGINQQLKITVLTAWKRLLKGEVSANRGTRSDARMYAYLLKLQNVTLPEDLKSLKNKVHNLEIEIFSLDPDSKKAKERTELESKRNKIDDEIELIMKQQGLMQEVLDLLEQSLKLAFEIDTSLKKKKNKLKNNAIKNIYNSDALKITKYDNLLETVLHAKARYAQTPEQRLKAREEIELFFVENSDSQRSRDLYTNLLWETDLDAYIRYVIKANDIVNVMPWFMSFYARDPIASKRASDLLEIILRAPTTFIDEKKKFDIVKILLILPTHSYGPKGSAGSLSLSEKAWNQYFPINNKLPDKIEKFLEKNIFKHHSLIEKWVYCHYQISLASSRIYRMFI